MVTRLRMPAFIATLAMMSIARGLASIITNGEQIVGFPDWFSNLAITRHFGFLTVTVGVMVAITVDCVDCAFLSVQSGGRSTPSAAARKSRGSPAFRPPIRDAGVYVAMRRCSRASRASFFQLASTRRSQAPASATSSTRSRRS